MKVLVDQVELNFPERMSMSDDEFFEFATQMNDNRIERDNHGNIFIMPLAGLELGIFTSNAAFLVTQWALENEGKVFSPSTGFTLPNGAVRSPDVSWISPDRYNQISRGDLKKFARVCPEFVLEIRSEFDRIKTIKGKMEEYMENGALLGFLIDPGEQKAYVYRTNQEVELVTDFSGFLSGYDVMPGFELPLKIFKVNE